MEFPRSHRGLTTLPRWDSSNGQLESPLAGGRSLPSRPSPVTHLVKRPGCRPGEASSILVRGASSCSSDGRALVFETKRCGFDSCQELHSSYCSVEQSGCARLSHTQEVDGSNPFAATNRHVAQLVEPSLDKTVVAGSTPAMPTNREESGGRSVWSGNVDGRAWEPIDRSARIAQQAERRFYKPRVAGSKPALRTNETTASSSA